MGTAADIRAAVRPLLPEVGRTGPPVDGILSLVMSGVGESILRGAGLWRGRGKSDRGGHDPGASAETQGVSDERDVVRGATEYGDPEDGFVDLHRGGREGGSARGESPGHWTSSRHPDKPETGALRSDADNEDEAGLVGELDPLVAADFDTEGNDEDSGDEDDSSEASNC